MSDDGRLEVEAPADEAGLRACYPEMSERVRRKVLDRLDEYCRRFIALSPLLVLGTARPGHGTDVSPRGDRPGFVRVLDDRTLAIPDRPGNNRLDSLSNLLANAEVGLLFFVPGIDETLRVNGLASLSREPALLAAAAVDGKPPRMILRVAVSQAFFHCGKALIRSRFWHEDHRVERKSFPSLARIITEQTKVPGITVEDAEARLARAYRDDLY